jgi:cytochrome b561
MLKNTPNSFGSIAKIFHWIIALLIIGMLAMGFIMADMAPSPTRMLIYGLHKSTGVLILLLVILRFTWRLWNSTPHMPDSLSSWHHRLAKLSPFAFYSLMFLMPLSGIVLSQAAGYPINLYNIATLPTLLFKNPDLSKTAALIHKYGAFAFIGILILHISAAFYHHFILKTNILKRMLPK